MFVASLLAKPTAGMVAVLAVTLLAWRGERGKLKALLPWIVLALTGLVLAKLTQPDARMPVVVPMWQRPFVAGDAAWFYLSRLFAPVGLSPLQLRAPDYIMGHWAGFATWVLPLATTLLLWHFFRGRGLLLAGLFIIPLLPVLGLVPFHYQANVSTVANRYVYISMLAPALAVGWMVDYARRVLVAARVLVLICVGCIVVLAVTSTFQSLHWRNSFTLFQRPIACLEGVGHPAANRLRGLAYTHLAAYSNNHGAAPVGEEFARAAIECHPGHIDAWVALAYSLALQGRYEEAVHVYDAVLAKRPDDQRVRQLRNRAASDVEDARP